MTKPNPTTRIDPSALAQPLRKTDRHGNTTAVAGRLHDGATHGYVTPRGQFVAVSAARTPADAIERSAAYADRTRSRVKLATKGVGGEVVTHGTLGASNQVRRNGS